MGVDLSAEAQMVKDITAKFTTSFGKNYTKMYAVALLKISKKQMEKEAKGSPWKLMKCLEEPSAPPVKAGVVNKLSKYLKNWNPRYVVVKGDYLIDYYENEDKFHKGAKPLGSINMSNRQLNRDANDTAINRLKALAEKCKIDISQMPQPDKAPDHTLEIYHETKGSILLQCPDAAANKEWGDVLDRCRWNAPRFDEWKDKANVWAFPNALWRTRWECDMWGWWWGGGGETCMLCDAVNQKIAYDVMGSVDAKLTMPWSARSRIRNKFMQTSDGVVTSAVDPFWKTLYSTVQKMRPELEAKIKEGMGPIVEAQQGLKTKIVEQAQAGAKDTLNKEVSPHLGPLLEIIFGPVNEAFSLLLKSYDVAVEKGKAKYEPNDKRMYLVRHYNYNSEYWDAYRKFSDLYDPLNAMSKVFSQVWPWSILSKAQRRLRKILNNALFTLENRFEEGKADGKTFDAAALETRQLLEADCQTAVSRVLGRILFDVVAPFFNDTVIKLSRKLVAPMADAVPDALKTFVDPEELLEEVMYDILRGVCTTVVEPYAAKVKI